MATMRTRDDLLICTACGTQFDTPASQPLKACRICDDPRQFVPPGGQSWTSLGCMRRSSRYTNTITPDPRHAHMYSIHTTPKFAIGQRCILLTTPAGNVLWDCITYLDAATTDFINSRGGLHAIVISHPHYYTTHLDWARQFDCPVYLAADDVSWACPGDGEARRKLLRGEAERLLGGEVTAIRVGGHFPGSLCLLWPRVKALMIADTLVTTPSGLYHVDRPPGTNSYVFMWSIPNMIPLAPDVMLAMWRRLKPYDFESTHGAFVDVDVSAPDVKARVLESMKIQVRAAGWREAGILDEEL